MQAQNPNIEAIIAAISTTLLAIIALLNRPIVAQIITFIISRFTIGKPKISQEVVDNLLRAMLETQQKCERTERELRTKIDELSQKLNEQLVINARLEARLEALAKRQTDEHKKVGS